MDNKNHWDVCSIIKDSIHQLSLPVLITSDLIATSVITLCRSVLLENTLVVLVGSILEPETVLNAGTVLFTKIVLFFNILLATDVILNASLTLSGAVIAITGNTLSTKTELPKGIISTLILPANTPFFNDMSINSIYFVPMESILATNSNFTSFSSLSTGLVLPVDSMLLNTYTISSISQQFQDVISAGTIIANSSFLTVPTSFDTAKLVRMMFIGFTNTFTLTQLVTLSGFQINIVLQTLTDSAIYIPSTTSLTMLGFQTEPATRSNYFLYHRYKYQLLISFCFNKQ
jgi:hypothetical protein